VLPDGEVREISGDELDLISDAEGISGLITQVVLRVRLADADVLWGARFDTAGGLTQALKAIGQAGLPLWSVSFINPKMAELKEKHKDDPNKLNMEMMGLYRKYGINPLGGCLPMLIQIPIFFGFFRMLDYAVELRGESFMWVNDLTQPDNVAFVMGIPINLLPIVMAGTSVIQMAMMPKTGDKMQQRIMMLMPLLFFLFCYNYASALALYWTVQNIFSIGQTYLMNKIPEPELVLRKDGGKKSWVQRMAEKQAEMQKLQRQRAKSGSMRNVTPETSKKKRPPRTGG
jgi:YidC/Oxa1 family membrane protein insertase